MNSVATSCVFFMYYFVQTLVVVSQNGCTFSAENGIYSPLLLLNNTLLLPTNGKIVLKPKDAITLLCPGTTNYFMTSENSHIVKSKRTATCVRENLLLLDDDDDEIAYDGIKCRKTIEASVVETNKKCANGTGEIYKIGYPVPTRHFISIINVCFDKEQISVLYSWHLLHGKEITNASKTTYRPSSDPEVAYGRTFQKSSLTTLLKSSKLAANYINHQSYLSRGHLSPEADFIHPSWQYATYNYINTSPQWQIITTSNWKRVEDVVRKFANDVRDTLDIFTGTHKVLQLEDADGHKQDIYLMPGKKLPVPKFVWKVVYSSRTKEAIVLVNLNNPFVSRVEKGDVLCVNICEETGWDNDWWEEYDRGFVYCCDYREFSEVVQTAPKLSVGGVLYWY